MRSWTAQSPSAARSLRSFYGGPVVGGSQHRREHGLLAQLGRDLASGRLRLVVAADSQAADDAFGRAQLTATTAPTPAFSATPASAREPARAPAPPAAHVDEAPEVDSSETAGDLPVDGLDQAAQVETLVTAARTGAPFCEECAKRAAAAG